MLTLRYLNVQSRPIRSIMSRFHLVSLKLPLILLAVLLLSELKVRMKHKIMLLVQRRLELIEVVLYQYPLTIGPNKVSNPHQHPSLLKRKR